MELFMRRSLFVVLSVIAASCANHAQRSIALYEAGDYAGARRAADEGLAAHPDSDDLWAMRLRAALALGDADLVANTYETMTKHDVENRPLMRELAVATLGQALASPSARLKVMAIEAIAQSELHELTEQVFQALGDDDDRVAAAAASAVLKGHPQAPQIADEMLRSENAEARRIAVDGVGKKVGKLAVADLEKAADDHDAKVRRTAIFWLGSIKDKDGVEILTRRMRDPDDSVRAAAATALARIGIGNLEALGKKALSDHALAVRLAGIDLLVAAHRDDEIVQLVSDADPMVAVEAAVAVRKSHPELGPKAIERALAAEEWTVRAGAANQLVSAVGKQAALGYAKTLAGDHELSVRLAAARVLAHTGDPASARQIFAAALEDADHGTQAAADLGALGDEAGLSALSRFVRDIKGRSPEQRGEAASAHRTAHRVTPGLVAALADPNGLVRVEAAATLAALSK
jgi:HEAT repeat protein